MMKQMNQPEHQGGLLPPLFYLIPSQWSTGREEQYLEKKTRSGLSQIGILEILFLKAHLGPPQLSQRSLG